MKQTPDKFQAPSSKLQRSAKFQAPIRAFRDFVAMEFDTFHSASLLSRVQSLMFGAWSFSGCWSLEFGASRQWFPQSQWRNRLGRPAIAGLTAVVLMTISASAESLSNTDVSGLPSALPDAGASVFRVFGALILVIAIFLGGVWLFRNWQRFTQKKDGGARLNLIEVKSLGQRQTLYVVGYQQQRMLLASSTAGVTLVTHLPAAEEAGSEAEAAPAPRMSFAEAFQQVLSRKQ